MDYPKFIVSNQKEESIFIQRVKADWIFCLCFGFINHISVTISIYTIFSNLSMKYFVMCKVYTDLGGTK